MATFKSWGMKFWAAVCLSAFSIIVCLPANGDVTPEVALAVNDSYMETDRGTIQVGLNYLPGTPVVVKLTVTPPNRTNPGELALDSSYKTVPSGYPALGDNEYYVSFKYNSTIRVDIASMDGTYTSSMYGFTVKAEVVTPEWSDAYVPATQCVYVQNVAPTIGSVTPENPNAWMVAGGVASMYPIRWQIRGDVDADLAAGITVRFSGCANAFTTNVTEATRGSFVPEFGSMIGSQTVTMTIEDKDGGGQTWTYLYEVIPPPPPQVAVEVNGAAVEFVTAADGKTRTAEVAAGTAAEDVKVFVGGVDVTAGFKVVVEGMTATVVLKEPYETARSEIAPYQAWSDNGDGSVTMNVEVVPGLYYAADSAATIEALKRPGAAEPAKAGDAVVAPKQEGAQGFYKVWVSDAPIEAE